MEICLICIGKTRIQFIKDGIEEYRKRLKHYIPFNTIEIEDIRTSKSTSEIEHKEKEGKLLIDKIMPSDFVIILDEKGKEYSSMEFASYFEKLMASGRKRIVFIVGGPYGFAKKVYDRADSKLSLSKMTFNHEMVRMFFIEQLYRTMTILNGEPYHHQ